MCLSFWTTCKPDRDRVWHFTSQFSFASSCATRVFVRRATFLRSSWMRYMLTCRGSGFFCAASGDLVSVRLVLINLDIDIDDYNLEKIFLWRLRTSGGRSVNTWRISPPVCLSYVLQRVDLQPHRLPLGLGSLIPHGFGSQIPNFVATW